MFDFFKCKGDTEYNEMLRNALVAFCCNDTDLVDDLLRITDGSKETAQQLYWFIPSALFKILFPNVQQFDDSYLILYPDNSKRVFFFSKNTFYQTVFNYVESVYVTLEKKHLLKILSYSSEFDAVNNALNNGSKLEDLVIYPPVFITD